jgi:hypothetical protein
MKEAEMVSETLYFYPLLKSLMMQKDPVAIGDGRHNRK